MNSIADCGLRTIADCGLRKWQPAMSPTRFRGCVTALTALASIALSQQAIGQAATEIRTSRPFGTLREQAERQQHWLDERMKTVLPALMRKHDIEMWVVPMREYNEDPVFSSLVSPTTFAARRRTIYVFFDSCAKEPAKLPQSAIRNQQSQSPECGVDRVALGGTSQGGVYRAVRSTKAAS